MNVLYRLFTEHKKNITIVAVCLFCLVATFFSGYLYGIRNIHHNGAGIGDVGKQLEQIESNQHTITSGIESVTGGISESKESIKSSQQAIDRADENAASLENSFNTAGESIADCQRILAEIRQRGKSQ